MSERAQDSHAARFRPIFRLRKEFEFAAVYKTGHRLGDSYFSISLRVNAMPHARLGLSIAARAIGNAVNRNRIKRVIRESFRTNRHRIPCLDVVISARPAANAAENSKLTQSLEQLWDKLARHA